jgi:hypothetical protein
MRFVRLSTSDQQTMRKALGCNACPKTPRANLWLRCRGVGKRGPEPAFSCRPVRSHAAAR